MLPGRNMAFGNEDRSENAVYGIVIDGFEVTDPR